MKQVFNPFLPLDTYIPDGEPHVFGDRVYLYGSHDKAGGESYCLLNYEVWSAPLDDLTNWTCLGISYRASQDPNYSDKRPFMFAPDVVRGNDGRYYLYYCLAGWKGRGGYDGPISVAVADKPDGPYDYYGYVQNADGSPFQESVLFDPALINDEGTIRLYYGANAPKGLNITRWNKWWASRILSKIFGRDKKYFTEDNSILGARQVVLADDMLTVKGPVMKINIDMSLSEKKKGHDFFEGASIRKINGIYFFIYSSQNNHELCYATSLYPDKDFCYQGILVSTGDVGLQGRIAKHRVQATGTTHGSIEKLNNDWFVFYHRLTHGSDYSRQACAERLTLNEAGKFTQVPVTSCGLNGEALSATGSYPAVIACHLNHSKTPHISNRVVNSIPRIISCDNEHLITGIISKTTVGYKYFNFLQNSYEITLQIRGEGQGQFFVSHDETMKGICGSINVTGQRNWTNITGKISTEIGPQPLYLKFVGKGSLDFKLIKLDED